MSEQDHEKPDDPERIARYRSAYDSQLRIRVPNPLPGEVIEAAGPVVRKTGGIGPGYLIYRDLGGLDGPALDAFIAGQRDHFAQAGQEVEWKYFAHDRPADLPARLRAAGFEPDEEETVMIGEAADLAADPVLPPGVRLREVTATADLVRIGALEDEVWGGSHGWIIDMLAAELAGAGDPCVVIVAEADEGDAGQGAGEGGLGQVVCAGWIRFHEGTDFTSLWGGSTLERWRGQGIYRALVACRARLAVQRGFRYLQVDASADSRPILARLGLLPVAVTTPYIWRAR